MAYCNTSIWTGWAKRSSLFIPRMGGNRHTSSDPSRNSVQKARLCKGLCWDAHPQCSKTWQLAIENLSFPITFFTHHIYIYIHATYVKICYIYNVNGVIIYLHTAIHSIHSTELLLLLEEPLKSPKRLKSARQSQQTHGSHVILSTPKKIEKHAWYSLVIF